MEGFPKSGLRQLSHHLSPKLSGFGVREAYTLRVILSIIKTAHSVDNITVTTEDPLLCISYDDPTYQTESLHPFQQALSCENYLNELGAFKHFWYNFFKILTVIKDGFWRYKTFFIHSNDKTACSDKVSSTIKYWWSLIKSKKVASYTALGFFETSQSN